MESNQSVGSCRVCFTVKARRGPVALWGTVIMPPQGLDLPTLLGKLYAENVRRQANYDRAVTWREARLAKERKIEMGVCRDDARYEVNTRVLSRLGEEKCFATPLWDYVIEKLSAKCDLDLDDSGGLGPRFRELLERYCRAVLRRTLVVHSISVCG